ncbi:RCF2 [[Candida] subhashii]|uniref:RCF2 n=1 Tax=[Candida] subhashii TaxID=561895 RepID=A0A8J5QC65_9ASCO|nr:RCF2 [[Candida] subhashii]KAG7663629.1 RCF2 [[Candida] subhashii]
MKILTKEEKQAHISHVLAEGAKGIAYGGVVAFGLFSYLKHRHPLRFKKMNASVKSAIMIMPTIGVAAFFADQGSWEFDKMMHQSEYQEAKLLEEFRQWNNMSMSDKIFTSLNSNKYPIIISAWAASLYGSWVLVNKDKIMTTAQKAVQARMYAQGITIILLLGTIVLSMRDAEIKKSQPAPMPEWKKVLLQQEEADKRALEEFRLKKEAEKAAAAAAAAATTVTAKQD